MELLSEEDVSKAMGHNNEHMGKRYVEIFRATKGQLEWEGRMAEKVGGGTGGVVRLRGLPFRCTEEDIRLFFQGLGSLRIGVLVHVHKTTCTVHIHFNSVVYYCNMCTCIVCIVGICSLCVNGCARLSNTYYMYPCTL